VQKKRHSKNKMKGEPKNPKLEGETELIIVCQLATFRIYA
jgi:hypothetical protein